MVPDSTLSSYFVTLEVPCTRLKTGRPLEVTSTTTSVSKCDQCDQKHSIEETRPKTRNCVHGGLRRCLFSFYDLCETKRTAVNHQINKKQQIECVGCDNDYAVSNCLDFVVKRKILVDISDKAAVRVRLVGLSAMLWAIKHVGIGPQVSV